MDIVELKRVLGWIEMMALMSLEDHRVLRVKNGHGDKISFQKANGEKWSGLYQSEWDDFVAFRKGWPAVLDELRSLRSRSARLEEALERFVCIRDWNHDEAADAEREYRNAADKASSLLSPDGGEGKG